MLKKLCAQVLFKLPTQSTQLEKNQKVVGNMKIEKEDRYKMELEEDDDSSIDEDFMNKEISLPSLMPLTYT